jgi:hypothetical protein
VVTVPADQTGQPLVRARSGRQLARPVALRLEFPLWLASALPFLALGVAATALPVRRWARYTCLWPRVPDGMSRYPLLGLGLLLLAGGYLVVAVLAYQRRGWARIAVVTLTAVFDMVLVMVLLADIPRTGWLVFGAAVVLCSLAGVVLCYQPEVDRYFGQA